MKMSRLNQISHLDDQENPEFIRSDEVFRATDNGLDVFKREIQGFTTSKNIRNPFLSRDDNPSAKIKQSKASDLWLLRVYNDKGGFYNAIQFIEEKYHLTFKEAIDYIMKDITLTPIINTKKTKVIKKIPLTYEVQHKDFQEEHKNYLCIHGIDEYFLNVFMDIYAVDKYGINGFVKEVPSDQYMFAYRFRDEEGKIIKGKAKLLFLGNNVDKKDKWRNNLDPHDFFYTDKIKFTESEYIFVTKSNKDCIPLAMCGITAIASMSENRANIIEGLRRLMPKYPDKKFIINMGTDEQGKKTSIAITQELDLQWFNTPNRNMINDINDNWEYFKRFGLKSFKKLLTDKNFI